MYNLFPGLHQAHINTRPNSNIVQITWLEHIVVDLAIPILSQSTIDIPLIATVSWLAYTL